MGMEATADPQQRAQLAAHLIAKLRGKNRPAGRERFVLFAPPLVRAILEGRKTVTRRLVKPPNERPVGNCPMGLAGDRLWVREKWGYHDEFFDRSLRGQGSFVYAADGTPPGAKFMAWKPSLHMPRAACRMVLDIHDTQFERLSQMTRDDALAEGCPVDHEQDPVSWFQATWDRYYAAAGCGWATDPWVWVIRFSVRSNSQKT